MELKLESLKEQIGKLDMSPVNILNHFIIIPEDSWEGNSPWDDFIDGTNVHLGKRSSGWKFCWNFHDHQYYYNKETLLKFIRSGVIINEYGEVINNEEFIEMALNWGEPDGIILDENYGGQYIEKRHYDIIIDGLRVSSSINFS